MREPVLAAETVRRLDVAAIGSSSAAVDERVSIASESPAWFYVTAFDAGALTRLESVPGVHRAQYPNRIRVPLNLVLARPEWFNVVFDPGRRVDAPATTDAAVAAVPSEVVAPHTGEVTELLPHQRVGVAHLRQPGGAILCDDVGLGKTLQAATAAAMGRFSRVLIIGPVNSRRVWCSENGDPWRRFGIKVEVLQGVKEAGKDLPKAGWVFIHYDILDAWFGYLAHQFQPECVILDEAHRVYGWKTKRATKVVNLCRLASVQARYVLTATQVRNDRANLFPLLEAAQPLAWGGNFYAYAPRYVGMVQGEYGLLTGREAREAEPDSVSTYDEEFDARLKHILLRREREEVERSGGFHIPGMDRQVIEVDLSSDDLTRYRAAEHDVVAHLRSRGVEVARGASDVHLREVSELCSLLSQAKIAATASEVEDSVVGCGHVLAYTWYRASAEGLAAVLRAHNRKLRILGPITGTTPVAKREKLVAEFRKSAPPCVLIATLGTLSEASNDLIVARVGIMHDLYWDPTPLLQGEGRLDRPGQAARVLWKYMRVPETIEDRMVARLEAAAKEIQAGRGGAGASRMAQALGGAVPEGDPLQSFLADILALPAELAAQVEA